MAQEDEIAGGSQRASAVSVVEPLARLGIAGGRVHSLDQDTFRDKVCFDKLLDLESRDALLMAIAKARAWVDDLVEGRAASFAEIAKSEGKSSGTSACWHHSHLHRRS